VLPSTQHITSLKPIGGSCWLPLSPPLPPQLQAPPLVTESEAPSYQHYLKAELKQQSPVLMPVLYDAFPATYIDSDKVTPSMLWSFMHTTGLELACSLCWARPAYTAVLVAFV
jgi:hypothetical protein